MQGMPRGFSLFEEAKDLYVELCSNSEFNPVLVSVMKKKKKKSYYPDITESLFQEGR